MDHRSTELAKAAEKLKAEELELESRRKAFADKRDKLEEDEEVRICFSLSLFVNRMKLLHSPAWRVDWVVVVA